MATDQIPCPFLRLPRELRDKIYEYCIYSPPPAKITARYRGNYRPAVVNTALLMVNQQIHDELAWMFYTRTVFPITIDLSCGLPLSRPGNGMTYYVTYYAPWEGVFMVYDDCDTSRQQLYAYPDPDDLYEGEQSIPYDLALGSNLSAADIQAIRPAPKYRGLIRHIRLEIYDAWRTGREPGPGYEYRAPNGTREILKKLLMPLAYRLEVVFGSAAAKKIQVEIKVAGSFQKPPAHWTDPDWKSDSWCARNEPGGIRTFDDFIETLAPLVTGSWIRGYTFHLKMADLKSKHPGLEEKVRHKLDLSSKRLRGINTPEEEDSGSNDWAEFDL